MNPDTDQIVMTGAGLVTCLGLSLDETWAAVRAGRCGVRPLSALEQALPGAEGGQAPDLPREFHPDLPREVRYLKWAMAEALGRAGGRQRIPYPADRCGILLGTTLHGMRAAGEFLRSGNFDALAHFLAGHTLRDSTDDLDFTGLAATTCSACSSSLGSIALAFTLLRKGELDLIVAGGYDTISEYVYGGFNSLRLVAPGPLRPFTRDRQGMKLAEGYGLVVLERNDDAKRRGAKSIARVLGYGESADAHHLTQPHPQGDGAARAMTAAMERAGLQSFNIDLVAAHATGTPDNDAAEYAALSRVFADRLPRTPVVAFKSHLGHTLGGAGAVELILSAMALRDQVLPGCANIQAEEIEFAGLRLTTGVANASLVRHTLNTSLGFGGANTCVVLGRTVDEGEPARPRAVFSRESNDVLITGIGVVLPGAVGNDAFARLLCDPSRRLTDRPTRVDEAEIAPLLNARRVRRMSEYVKLSLAATVLCLRDAGVEGDGDFAQACAAVLGTTHGSSDYCEAYYRQIVKEGIAAANPMLFAEGVPNAAAAHLSLMLSLKGACQSVIGTRTAGLDAIRLAAARIASGEWDRAIVGAAEECGPLLPASYRHWGLCNAEDAGEAFGAARGFVAGAGAVTLLLEGRRSVQARGGRVLGRVARAASAAGPRNFAWRNVSDTCRGVGAIKQVITSANGTWIDRAERAGLNDQEQDLTVSSLYGHVAESFSVLPLASIAAALLTGRLPRLASARPRLRRLCAADGSEAVGRFAVLCTDYSGPVSGVAIEKE